MPWVDAAVRDDAAEHVDEIRAVHAVHGGPASRVRSHDRRDPRPVMTKVSGTLAHPAADLVERRAEPKPVQQSVAVRPDKHTSPDFPQRRCLLVNSHLDARPGQRRRGGESADAAAHYRRRQPRAHRHYGILPYTLRESTYAKNRDGQCSTARSVSTPPMSVAFPGRPRSST